MAAPKLYPLRFTPIFQYRLWGGRHLSSWLTEPLPEGSIGEAWLLSDRDDEQSVVVDGPLKGRSIRQLIEQWPREMLGPATEKTRRFPVLLKFLDVQKMLSVQVHPSDSNSELIPAGETGKTEAWVVLEAKPTSRIYAGLQPGADRKALATLTVQSADKALNSFTPERGQAIEIDAGVVHSLGDGVVVVEIQQNSDITYRLYDWDHIDPKTGKPRPLQVDRALACIDFDQGPVRPKSPQIETSEPYRRERLFDNPHFRVWRLTGEQPFPVGAKNEPRILVCLDGAGQVHHSRAGDAAGADCRMSKGSVVLLPAALGACVFQPDQHVSLLDIAGPAQT